MAVIIVGNEKNFAGLRPRLFSGRVSNTVVREVTDSIAAANPHVDLQKLEPGTVLTVPESPHVSLPGDLSLDDATKQFLGGVADSGADALEELLGSARAAEREAAAERKQLLALLGRDDVGSSRTDKESGDDLDAVRKAVEAEEAAAKQRAAALKEAQAGWSAELKALRELLG
jgi:hypothetical protein